MRQGGAAEVRRCAAQEVAVRRYEAAEVRRCAARDAAVRRCGVAEVRRCAARDAAVQRYGAAEVRRCAYRGILNSNPATDLVSSSTIFIKIICTASHTAHEPAQLPARQCPKVSPSLIGQSLLLNTRGGDESAFAKLVLAKPKKGTPFCISAGSISIKCADC